MDWFLYDRDLCHERVKQSTELVLKRVVGLCINCRNLAINLYQKCSSFTEIFDCQKFTKLDPKDAYRNISLDESSRNLLITNIYLRLFKPTRLALRVKSVTETFT